MAKSITEIRREEITEAVLRLLAQQGPRALSAQLIADTVGMAKASLYQHFDSVDEMVEAAVVRVGAMFMEMLQQARSSATNPIDVLRNFIHSIMNLPTFPAALQSLERIESESVLKWRRMMLSIRDRFLPELAKEVKAAQDAGQIRNDVDAAELVELMVALHHFEKVKHGHLQPNDEDDYRERLERAWQLFCRLTDKRSEF